MKIIDHGEWTACPKPENYPVKLPSHILFSKRVSDGQDWYMFQRRELRDAKGLFVIAVPADDGGLSVITTTHDVTALFPTAGMRLFEVLDAPEDHEKLRMQRLDLKKKRFVPPPPQPPTMMQMIMEELGLDAGKMQAKLDAARKNRSTHG
jgi:hypothetical protein